LEKDYDRSLFYHKKACEGNEKYSCFDYGFLKLSGKTGKIDINGAVNSFNKGCNQNHQTSCVYLSLIYSNPHYIKPNVKKALEFKAKSFHHKNKVYDLVFNSPLSSAHSKIVLGHLEEAKTIYLKYIDEKELYFFEDVLNIDYNLSCLRRYFSERGKEIEELKDSVLMKIKLDYREISKIKEKECEREVTGACYELGWANILMKNLNKAEIALNKEKNNNPDNYNEFNEGHLVFLKGDIEKANLLYRDGILKWKRNNLFNKVRIDHDFKMLSEVYPEYEGAFNKISKELYMFMLTNFLKQSKE